MYLQAIAVAKYERKQSPMNNIQKYAIELSKDIVIAKLSSSAPNHSNEVSGKAIGEMFEAVYNKVYEICSKEESK